jgi:iron complex outermembrane receptor protein
MPSKIAMRHPKLNILCMSIAAACAPLHAAAQVDVQDDPAAVEVQTVLTPTRLRQSLSDVPGSVTVITADMIAKFGITSIPEALRLVPGMMVTQVGGSDYRINYHGTSILTPRRMNVLVDGLSVYRPGFARVDWQALPIALSDIDRIEVTRGPNSASYGANSLLAIINIISKHPDSQGQTSASASKGSRGTLAQQGTQQGSTGHTAYRVTADHSRDEGYDLSGKVRGAHDFTSLNRLTASTSTDFADGSNLDIEVALLDQFREVEYVDAGQITFPDLVSRDIYINSRWQKNLSSDHGLQVSANAAQHTNKQGWTTCVPTAYLLPEMAQLWTANKAMVGAVAAGKMPTVGTPEQKALALKALNAIRSLGKRASALTCVDANQDLLERRLEAELQDTVILSNAARIVSGLGVRANTADSQTYLAGRFIDTILYAFASAEYKWGERAVINAGGFYERTTIAGSAFSPRLALNYRVSDNGTFRFVLSRSSHMPDIQEEKTNWSYTVTNLRPALPGVDKAVFFQTAQAHGGLEDEKIMSREIGYLGNYPELGLMIDGKVFRDSLTNTISEKLQVSDYAPTNNNSVSLSGIELQVTYSPTDRFLLHGGYSHLNNIATNPLEQTQYGKHNGSLAASYLFANDINLSGAYYRTTGSILPNQTAFGREDLTLSRNFHLTGKTSMTATFTVQHFDDPTLTYPVDVGSVRQVSYKNAFQYLFTLKLNYQ